MIIARSDPKKLLNGQLISKCTQKQVSTNQR